jgi:hypothetical protein
MFAGIRAGVGDGRNKVDATPAGFDKGEAVSN